jgi:PKD repeat protein
MYERCSIDVKIGLKRALTCNKQDVPRLTALNLQNNTTTPLFLVSVLLIASISPIAMATTSLEYSTADISAGNLDEFDPSIEGNQYMFTNKSEPVYSATSHLKKQWIEDGYPNLVLPFSHSYTNSRASTRNCTNSWNQGDVDTIPTSSGNIIATVQKISSNAAIFIENGQILSATSLNDLASTFESTIYPTDTNYFGSMPDVDNNCQLEIVILGIDGGGGTGGYFAPGISSQRESIFIDVDDMSWRNTILAHELQHLLHNARDPYENLWIDEGAADMAAYLCFGVTSTLSGHANDWAQNSNMSVRWWNQRIADYGAGFMFLMYLADKLGGGSAISSLVADTATGGAGIENLAANPQPGSISIGTTMSEIYANFSIAVTLDSPQGAFGFSNLDLSEACTAAFICKAQKSGYNDQWVVDWSSNSDSVEGWGMRSYKFAQGSGAPLNLMVSPTQFGFEGVVMSKESATGTWSMNKLRIDPASGAGTGLVYGFGNTTDEIWLITWYESLVSDCDYNFASCGITTGSYPEAAITVQAGLITDPAEVEISTIENFDRDGDNLDDSSRIDLQVTSNAFFEILEVEANAYLNNSIIDTLTFDITAGNSVASEKSIWFTPPEGGDWTYSVKITDVTGVVVDQAFALPENIANMEPVASGSMATNITQTWLPIAMYGSGYDAWGFSQINGTFSHNETPIAYFWDLGDNTSSGLKNPTHSYLETGLYTVVLTVEDKGGYFSAPQSWIISVNDTSVPVPVISVDGVVQDSELILMTNQRVQFSALSSQDNVPINEMIFTWNWGDGQIEQGKGLAELGHAWVDGSADGIVHTLTLTIDDGNQFIDYSIYIKILNRVPQQIFEQTLQTFTLTPLEMPIVFEDQDGFIVEYRWSFNEGVNTDGSGMTLTSDYSITESVEQNPIIGWKEPGLKNITLEVTDDDGNTSTASLQVLVINQRPVAVFARPSDGQIDTEYVFESLSFDPDGNSSSMQIIWNISDFEEPVYNVTSVYHTFTKPGLYRISLIVIDEVGLPSAEKSYTIRIDNPLPVPILEFRQPSMNGTALDHIPSVESMVTWQVPFTENGGAFIAPSMPLLFDGAKSYDSDPMFENMVSNNQEDPEWNGITRWIWDFGDSSPQEEGFEVWHQYQLPGTYVVKLTVVDGFEAGETNSTSMIVYVSRSPEIITNDPTGLEYVIVGDIVALDVEVIDIDIIDGIEAWLDTDISVDSDGDGDYENDQNQYLSRSPTIQWDLNIARDGLDNDGNTMNDFVWGDQIWSLPEYQPLVILVQVCDGVNVCITKQFEITVLGIEEDSGPLSISDLTWEDFVPDAESAGLLALIATVLLLGWLIMRQKDEEELDAEGRKETYDVQEVVNEGGLPGMDQHNPPPQPKYLTTEERRNKESGYIRPIRTRRK